ncbi:hypothetical protein TVAG_494970 [Trichomonas vaginalis G3]|uniref:Protein kinase domain-containing protein n=1 Tax=Trichomonas vaginalis (strain ATCC PRA-98 / G3) TaxID=412133 RepID=A2EXU4_TRIV3|nr:protein serine/threonine kinase protein [Trichomonas vaginalis G3]EAY02548.1 hypothetical protein TVAG_494970 [Trichomonas vaginalis G3]KAI5506040.1 protein serine/threonine kinase protein [Trichomonas vaginalis G3]|eukprot:XP_001314787.1 hypothetical protein [Trichomonas vaginalis G3]
MEPEEAEYFEKHGLIFQEVIAHGGYGMIFKMYSPSYNQIFALKKISSELFHPEEIDCFKLIDDNRILNLYKSYAFNGFNYP